MPKARRERTRVVIKVSRREERRGGREREREKSGRKERLRSRSRVVIVVIKQGTGGCVCCEIYKSINIQYG